MTAQLLSLAQSCVVHRNSYSCDSLTKKFPKLSSMQIKWMAFLSTKRDTFIIPTANCLGYIKKARGDGRVDPNRDFPYSRSNNRCLLSTTAKIFVEVMAKNLIQLVVTFHGGMVAIGYEWGAKNHMPPNDKSPDDRVNSEISTFMRAFAGNFRGEKLYPGNLFIYDNYDHHSYHHS